jgi:hypothetical protein
MNDFTVSKHAAIRANQRAFRASDIKFVLEHGTHLGSGIMLTNKDVQAIECEARLKANLARRLKGTFLPISEGVVKTAFKASKTQQSKFL